MRKEEKEGKKERREEGGREEGKERNRGKKESWNSEFSNRHVEI